MRSQMRRTALAAIVTTLLATMLTPTAAHAAWAGYSYPGKRDADGTLYYQLGSDITAGDCVQFAGSKVVLTKPGADGWSQVIWTATMTTRHTRNNDVWHGTFGFGTLNTWYTSANMDGPKMYTTNAIYRAGGLVWLHIDPVIYPYLQFVEFEGDC
jgi:hypothetical protein